jgi:C4-dicarboxylate-specific signal transduction histidine kinase
MKAEQLSQMRASTTSINSRSLESEILRFGLAAVLVAAALQLTFLLQSVLATAGFLFFYIAIVIAAWFGGAWAGGLAVLLSIVALEYYFVPPIHSFHVSHDSLPVFIEFAVSAAVVGWFSSWRRQAENQLQQARDLLQVRVEERTAELRQANEQLLAEIAERKRAEDAYHEAQAELGRVTRISALGTLAASISHEVNQPLAAVVTNADACMMWLSCAPPNLEEARSAMESIVQQGTRASEVVRRIRAMFTKTTPERTEVQLNVLVEEMVTHMRTDAARNQVEIEMELTSNLPTVICDRVQLQQVIVNLVQNGMEAMRGVTGRTRRIVIRSGLSDQGEALVSVKDSGTGIDPKDERRVFDAFFTTKGQGMGMGLSISHSIVEAHNGRLWVTRNPDHGATFQFTLPVEERVGNGA